MECTARILRERKVISHTGSKQAVSGIQVYCPIMGELTFFGEQAEKIREKLKERLESKPGCCK